MKLEHSTVVTSAGKEIVTRAWHTGSGKTTSQNITSTGLKSGKVDCFGKDANYRRAIGVMVDILDMVTKDEVKWANAMNIDTPHGDLVKPKT